MPYAYEKLIQDKKLSLQDLPEEVQVAIDEIKKADRGISLYKTKCEKSGKEFKLRPDVLKKQKAMDSFAVRGIHDFLLGKEVVEETPHTAEEVLDDVVKGEKKKEEPGAKETEQVEVTKKDFDKSFVMEIESELASLEKEKYTLEDLRGAAPKCHKLIFDSYESEGKNGITTSKYELLETDKEIFSFKKLK